MLADLGIARMPFDANIACVKDSPLLDGCRRRGKSVAARILLHGVWAPSLAARGARALAHAQLGSDKHFGAEPALERRPAVAAAVLALDLLARQRSGLFLQRMQTQSLGAVAHPSVVPMLWLGATQFAELMATMCMAQSTPPPWPTPCWVRQGPPPPRAGAWRRRTPGCGQRIKPSVAAPRRGAPWACRWP